MEEFNGTKQRTHKLTLNNRRSCTVTGVADVLSFDVSEIMLETDQGMLMIKGSELREPPDFGKRGGRCRRQDRQPDLFGGRERIRK